jgi:hypothetical protein
MLAKLGVETVPDVIGAWKRTGKPTGAEIRLLFLEDKPKDRRKT